MPKLADKLKLPIQVVTESVAILAKRRAGKSTTARRLAEQLHKAKQQVIVTDPKGDWWGLLFARDGKSPGLPFVVLGGEHGHIKLEVGAGELVARMVVTERVSLVLDLSQFRKHEVATFMTAFMETLYRLKAQEQYRTPMMLIIDEADAVAPQRPMRGEERMLGAAEDLVRRGGQRGIGVTMITQRAAVLNKNLLTQINILLILRTIAPQDLAAMDAWIDVHGTVEQRKELMASLPSLPTGEGWVWAPGWPDADGIFQRCAFLLPDTFDSSATPGQQKRVEPKHAADVDLEAFKREMSATIEKAKADDPRELRKQIADLKKEVAKKQPVTVSKQVVSRPPKLVEKPVITDAQLARVEKLIERVEAAMARAGELVNTPLASLKNRLQELVTAVRAVRQPSLLPAAPRPTVPNIGQANTAYRNPARERPRATAPNSDTHLPPGERATLIAAAQYPDGITREQASILTGYKRSSRDAYIQRLRDKQLVAVVGDRVVATDAGVAALGNDHEPLPVGAALQAYWLNRLPPGEKAVLESLLQHYPHAVGREAIDEATGYKRSSRDAYIQRLKARQLVTIHGTAIRARDVLFEGA